LPTITITRPDPIDTLIAAFDALAEHVCDISEETAIAYAKNGATLLDEKKPDWWRTLDLDVLDLKDCSLCVVGQTFGGYATGMTELFGPSSNNAMAFKHGFDSCSMTGVERLHGAWCDEVMSRRASAALV
jgi:hypothetical protein